MLRIELELKRLHLLSVIRLKSAIEYFADEKPSAVPLMNPQDDHLPFLRSGVPVTHLIPQPFPAVWHTMDDDGSAINPEVLDDYSRILRVFLTQYMQLESAIRQT
jgi:glutaminyl-peptide cyclotransferase